MAFPPSCTESTPTGNDFIIPGASNTPSDVPTQRPRQYKDRQQILKHFGCRSSLPHIVDDRHVKFISANGDVLSDVTVAWRVYNEHGTTAYLRIVRDVYGMIKLTSGSNELPPLDNAGDYHAVKRSDYLRLLLSPSETE